MSTISPSPEKPAREEAALAALLSSVRWLGAMAAVLAVAACVLAVYARVLRLAVGVGDILLFPAFLAALYALWLVWRLWVDGETFRLLSAGELSPEDFDTFLFRVFGKKMPERDMLARIAGTRRILLRLFAALGTSLACCIAFWIAVLLSL